MQKNNPLKVEVENLLPEREAFKIYNDEKLMARLTKDQLRVVFKSVWYYDTKLFAEDVCKRWLTDKKSGVSHPVPGFHVEMWQYVDKEQDVLLIEPRGYAKTTAVSKILVLKFLLYRIEPSVLLITTKGLGEEIVGDIKRELEENEIIRFVFGAMVPTEKIDIKNRRKWRQRELQLLNDTELKSVTKGESIRGKRPTKVIVDDPQEYKDVKNPVMAAEYWTWFWTTVYPALNDGGTCAVLGTIISNNCFVNQLKQQFKDKNFKMIERPAIKNFDKKKWSGVPLWPERFDMEKLKQKYDKMGEKEFMQEFMHTPYVPNSRPVFSQDYIYVKVVPIFEEDDVQYFLDPKDIENVYIGIDTSLGQVGGDYQAISARDGEYRLVAQYRGYCSQDILALKLDKILSKFDDYFIVPENNNGLVFLKEAKNYDWVNRIYRYERMDKATEKKTEVLGWSTNGKTKPLMINAYDKVIREGDFEVSEILLEEIEHFYHNEKGGMEATAPYHDDLLIADTLSIQAIKNGVLGSMVDFI